MRLSKLSALALLSVLSLGVAGCSGTDTVTEPTETETVQAEATEAEATEAEPTETETESEEATEKAEAEEGHEAAEFPMTFTSSAGEITVEEAPEKIAVLEWGALDTIAALGMGDKVVAAPMGVLPEDFKAQFPNVVDLGSHRELDKEALALAEPDLVIAGIRTQELGEELKNDYVVYDDTVDYSDYVDSAIAVSHDIGEMIGADHDLLDEKIDAIKESEEKLKEAAEGKGKTMVLMASGGEISTFPRNNRMSSLLFDIAGLTPANEVKSNENHGEVISYEAVREVNPEYIFVYDRDTAIGAEGAESAQVMMDNDLINETDAAKENHIFYPNAMDQYIKIHGLDNLKNMLDELAGYLNS